MIVFSMLTFVAGVILGAVGHSEIVKEKVATKLELAAWAQRLRNAIVADSQIAKNEMRSIISVIEQKL